MASAGAGALGAGVGLYQTIQGSKQAKEARQALEDYQRQELVNTGDGLQVSTMGADIQREEQQRMAATQMGALQEGGTRAILGGAGRVESGNQRVNRQIGADLDMQQKQIDQYTAQEGVRLQGMMEQRENMDINALSSQYNTGQQNMMSGFGNIIAGTGQAGVGIENKIRENKGLAPITLK